MALQHDNDRSRPLTNSSGMEFYARRVFQRWSRGEISTETAVQLLRPADPEQPPAGWQASARRRLRHQVTLEIDPASVADDETVGMVGLRLVHMGGEFVFWKPDENRRPALARFEFTTADLRRQFLSEALQIPGVSQTTLQ